MIATFKDPVSGEAIELSESVVELLSTFKQKAKQDVERGGLLFANPAYTDRVVIDSASPPHHKDRSTRMSLILDHGRCTAEIRKANDEGRWFVGYWHTHPEVNGRISPADTSAFFDNLMNRTCPCRLIGDSCLQLPSSFPQSVSNNTIKESFNQVADLPLPQCPRLTLIWFHDTEFMILEWLLLTVAGHSAAVARSNFSFDWPIFESAC